MFVVVVEYCICLAGASEGYGRGSRSIHPPPKKKYFCYGIASECHNYSAEMSTCLALNF